MIKVYEGKTADLVWKLAFEDIIKESDNLQASRGGATIEFLHTIFTITEPKQRWVISRNPALNPAFALAEVIWILSGSNDAGFLNYWNSQLPKYAGTDSTYYGAYGYRLVNQFGINQIDRAYNALKNNPESRQINLQIWHPKLDLPLSTGKPANSDIPCNIVSLLKVRDGKLEWTQVMRSNDIFLGTPHNFIQFSSLQEIIAGWLDIEVGHYHHYSDSLHLYKDRLDKGIGIVFSPESILNTDTLALSRAEFDKVFKQVKDYAYSLTEGAVAKHNLLKSIEVLELPKSYKNIVVILAAEAARREGWENLIDEIISICDNPLYTYLWKRWVTRVS